MKLISHEIDLKGKEKKRKREINKHGQDEEPIKNQ
jgi:hypothetical protein